MESRKSLMAKIHIAQKDLGLDEDTYRAMLFNLTGKISAASCTDRQLVAVIAALRKRGWKGSLPKAPKVRPEFAELLKKINALRLETKSRGHTSRQSPSVCTAWAFLARRRAPGGVITALVKHQRAQERA